MCALRRRLVAARTRRGWSQLEVADKIGTTHVNISRWERGLTQPRPYFRLKLCELFGKSEQELDLVGRSSDDSESGVPGAVSDSALPLPLAQPLIGRDAMIGRLKECLGTLEGTLVTISGLPGVGKTALALALAHDPDLRAHFSDGVLWAALGPCADLAEHFRRWSVLVGGSEAQTNACATLEEWRQVLRVALGHRSFLLVIDDAWKLEHVSALQVGGPFCAHVVTTRFPAIAAHVAGRCAMHLDELGEEEGLSLLRELAPFAVETAREHVAHLVQVVGGLPLALSLMGVYLRKEGASGQPRRVLAALRRLACVDERFHMRLPQEVVSPHPGLPEGVPLSLSSVLAASVSSLAPSTREVLRALSVFPPKPLSFSEEEALRVTGCDLADLDALVDGGLLESCGPGRYTLHPVIADYARLD